MMEFEFRTSDGMLFHSRVVDGRNEEVYKDVREGGTWRSFAFLRLELDT